MQDVPTNDALVVMAVSALALNVALYGFIYMVGGSKRAASFAKWELGLIRRLLAKPLLWLGGKIQGKPHKKKKGGHH